MFGVIYTDYVIYTFVYNYIHVYTFRYYIIQVELERPGAGGGGGRVAQYTNYCQYCIGIITNTRNSSLNTNAAIQLHCMSLTY